jgi:small subunit ribosomal protein S3
MLNRGKPMFDLWHERYKSIRYVDKKSYGSFLLRDYKIRKLIQDHSTKFRLDIAEIVIYGTKELKIELHTSKPGLVLGKSGSNLAALKAKIGQIAELPADSINVSLISINKPELNASLIAHRVAQDLEKRRSYNHSMRSHAEDAIRFGALGVKIQCGGRLNGVEIARCTSVSRGKLSRMTQRANVYYSASTAHTASGECGVKVWLNLPIAQKKKAGFEPKRPTSQNRQFVARPRPDRGEPRQGTRAEHNNPENKGGE